MNLPDDFIVEILSWLPVKTLMRLRCVCKSWNTLIISDPTLVKLHLERSALHSPRLFLQQKNSFCVTRLSGPRLVENPWTSLNDVLTLEKGDRYKVIGSCNGLICLLGIYFNFEKIWFCLWNPATRLISRKLGSYFAEGPFKLSFGYDHSTDTYKVVKFVSGNLLTNVSVFTLGNNVWRDIQQFPLFVTHDYPFCLSQNNGVQLSGSLNWIASRSIITDQALTVEQFQILSLDLTTERNTLFSLPLGFNEAPRMMPSVGVLMDCLCFSHDLKATHFVIWLMNKFGDAESWTQFLKISYQDLGRGSPNCHISCRCQLFPMHLYNGDTLMLASLSIFSDDEAILYDKRANTVERTILATIGKNIKWTSHHVESLAWPLGVQPSTTVTVARLNFKSRFLKFLSCIMELCDYFSKMT